MYQQTEQAPLMIILKSWLSFSFSFSQCDLSTLFMNNVNARPFITCYAKHLSSKDKNNLFLFDFPMSGDNYGNLEVWEKKFGSNWEWDGLKLLSQWLDSHIRHKYIACETISLFKKVNDNISFSRRVISLEYSSLNKWIFKLETNSN